MMKRRRFLKWLGLAPAAGWAAANATPPAEKPLTQMFARDGVLTGRYTDAMASAGFTSTCDDVFERLDRKTRESREALLKDARAVEWRT